MKSSIPFRERNFKYHDRAYSREKTQQLVNMFKEYGASVVLFNDPKVKGVKYWDGHANHLHVKFDASKTQAMCKKMKMHPKQVQWRSQCGEM